MDPDVEALIRQIHSTPSMAVIATTGGAAQALSWLLSVPGASNTVLEATVPYYRDSLIELLGGQEPDQFCSEATAADMARAAYRRAAALAPFATPILGVAATCSLATEPVKRGEHRAFVAVAGDAGRVWVAAARLAKGSRSRWQEDDVASRLLLQELAQACGLDGLQLPLPPVPGSTLHPAPQPPPTQPPAQQLPRPPAVGAPPGLRDEVQRRELPCAYPDPLAALLAGGAGCVEFSGSGQVVVDAPRPGRVYLPGSFNPLHAGHLKLLEAACAAAGVGLERGCFELSVGNADKGLLPLEEVQARVTQFTTARIPLVVTSAPLFVAKAALFPRSRFAVGLDTAVRLVAPRYYGGSDTQMLLEFEALRQQGCSFLVAGRVDSSNGVFHTMDTMDLPPALSDLFAPIREGEFRVDISSTELRRKALEAAGSSGANSGASSGGGS